MIMLMMMMKMMMMWPRTSTWFESPVTLVVLLFSLLHRFYGKRTAHTEEGHLFSTKMSNGWVIVYLPGGDVYQEALEYVVPVKKTNKHLKRAARLLLTCAQIYWWLRS